MSFRKLASQKRSSVKNSDPMLRRLAAYSATAGAALMTVPVADAAIQNITTFSYDGGTTFSMTPPDVNANPSNSSHFISFTGATPGHGFGFFGSLTAGHFSNSTSLGFAGIWASAESFAATFSGNQVKNLSFDAPIAGATNFINGSLMLASKGVSNGTSPFTKGSFVPNGNSATKNGYVGFRSGSYYGWLRVKVVNDGGGLPFELTLADKSNDGIYGAIGQLSDNIKAGEIAGVPEPSVTAIGGLGLLALGAAGLRELRRRRKQEAAN